MEPEPTPPPETPAPPPPEPSPATGPAEPTPTAEVPPETAIAEGAPVVEKPKKEPKKPRKRPSYEMKLFENYDLTEVEIHDAGLAKYINLSRIVIPHSGGRWANKPFGKAKANLVARLINNMMCTEKYTGMKAKSYRVVRSAFECIRHRMC